MNHSVQAEIERLREEIRRHNRLYFVEARPGDHRPRVRQADGPAATSSRPSIRNTIRPTAPRGRSAASRSRDSRRSFTASPCCRSTTSTTSRQLGEFDARIQKLVPNESIEYTVEYKVDGVAMAVIYENGSLVQAVTRGDGTRGDEITSNARTIRGVPLRLHTKSPPAVIEIRGEAYIANTDFAALLARQKEAGKEAFANPRNTAAGALKLLDPKLCAARRRAVHGPRQRLSRGNRIPKPHGIPAYHPRMGHPHHAEGQGLSRHAGGPRVREPSGRGGPRARLRGRRHRAQGKRLRPAAADGPHEQKPRAGSIAYKWEKYEATTLVENIDVHVGKTGTLTPVRLSQARADRRQHHLPSQPAQRRRDRAPGHPDRRLGRRRKGGESDPARRSRRAASPRRNPAAVPFPQALSRVPDARRPRRGRRLHPLPEPELPRPTAGEPPLFRLPQCDGHRRAGHQAHRTAHRDGARQKASRRLPPQGPSRRADRAGTHGRKVGRQPAERGSKNPNRARCGG